MTDRLPTWVRVGLVALLAVPQLLIGVWATLSPQGWFDSFGVGESWVAADPPFNEHLVSDVGAGFLATGVALVLAAVWNRRSSAVLALVTHLVFTVPHALFHTVSPAESLSTADQVASAGSLWSGALFAAVLLIGATRSTAAPVMVAPST